MHIRLPGLAVAALVAAPAVASAGSVTVQFSNVDPRQTIKVYLDDADLDSAADRTITVLAGEMDWKVVGTPDTQHTFCIELVQNITYGQTVTFAESDLGDAVANIAVPDPKVGPFSAPLTTGHVDLLEKFWNLYIPQVNTHAGAAAFQLGIWEIVYDGGGIMNTTTANNSGMFWADEHSPAWGTAVGWLNDLVFVNHTGRTNLSVWTNPDTQDQIFQGPPPATPTVTPSPAAVLPALAGCGLLACFYRPTREPEDC